MSLYFRQSFPHLVTYTVYFLISVSSQYQISASISIINFQHPHPLVSSSDGSPRFKARSFLVSIWRTTKEVKEKEEEKKNPKPKDWFYHSANPDIGLNLKYFLAIFFFRSLTLSVSVGCPGAHGAHGARGVRWFTVDAWPRFQPASR